MNISHLALRANSGGALPIGGFARLESRGSLFSSRCKRIGFRLQKLILILVSFSLFSAIRGGCAPSLTLAWDANTEADIAGYELRYGESSGNYTSTINAGPNTTADVTGLTEGKTYYFVVSAYNTAGLRSNPSAEISDTVDSAATLSPENFSIRYVDSEQADGFAASYAIDGDPATFWHTMWRTANPPPPHELQIDLGSIQNLRGFHYLPRQDGILNGNVGQYEFYISNDGVTWESPIATGSFTNTKEQKEVVFTPKSGRYVRLRALTDATGGNCTSIAELKFLLADSTLTSSSGNTAPSALPQSLTTAEDTPVSIKLTGSDIEGSPLSYSIMGGPANGALTGTAPNLTYTPAADFNGGDSFSFQVNDGTANSNIATVSITVTPVAEVAVNVAPVFASGTILASGTEDITFNGQLTATDANPGDVLTYSKVSGPQWLNISPSGQLSGTPLNSNVGANTFSVKATDPSNASATAILTVTVSNTNDAPVFKTNPLVFPEAAETIVYPNQTLAGSASDPDTGDNITYSKVSGPSWLGVSPTGVVSGTPPAGSAGLRQFTVRASDAAGAFGDSILEIQVLANTLPLPWSVDRIGNETLAGGANYNSGNYNVTGSGILAATQDAANYGWQTLTADGEITARVKKLDSTGSSPFVGLMIRESLAANSRQIFIGVSNDANYRWFRRTSTGATTTKSTIKNSTPTSIWLRLVRKANVITAYRSANGTSWNKVGSTTITLPKNCYIGMSVSSGTTSDLNTSTFSNVSVVPTKALRISKKRRRSTAPLLGTTSVMP